MMKHHRSCSANQDVSDKTVLLIIAEELGLDKKVLEQSLESSEFADNVEADVQKAVLIGVQGVPFFVVDDTYGISDARGIDAFVSVLVDVC